MVYIIKIGHTFLIVIKKDVKEIKCMTKMTIFLYIIKYAAYEII